jgi:hypothetical protein
MAEALARLLQGVARGRLPFRWMEVSMRNFGVPEDSAQFRRDVEEIAQALRRATP